MRADRVCIYTAHREYFQSLFGENTEAVIYKLVAAICRGQADAVYDLEEFRSIWG